MAKKQLPKKPASPFKMVVQSLPFHDFVTERKLVALYKDTLVLGDEEKLDKDGKPTTFTVNLMVDMTSGEEKFVQNSYGIHKAITAAKAEHGDDVTNVVFEIELLNKTVVKGKPFNQFKIGYCTMEEYESFGG